jgi:cysteinyl-tRNA synthetase
MASHAHAPPSVAGLHKVPVSLSDKHPVWYAPVKEPVTSLHVLNSLTESVTPFTAINGRVVKWYTCGPTVYDMSHMGHARAYLTFDIIRRIMEDYFGYAIEYQMNITDIDDKIIKRARVNKLVADYTASAVDLEVVSSDVHKAIGFVSQALDVRGASLSEPLSKDANSRDKEERNEQLKILEMKRGQLSATAEQVHTAKLSGDVKAVIKAASGVLGEWLDAEKGASITDHDIFNAHSRKYEAEYFEDMRALGVRDPDVISRVTEVVPQVVTFVQKIIDNGFAYVGESSVFFDTEAFTAKGHKYPKNHPTRQDGKNTTSADEMAEGEGTLSSAKASEKKSANDFALWKFSKPGEPAWPSPWGPGRPGWHIECSVMASEVLGANMDIHAGGCDLKFPHHDNELAQSEAFWGNHQWVNYFFHCGHLHIQGLKMSKSLKNFITIRQALDPEGELKITPRQMRLLFLSQSWHENMNFSDQSIGEARELERVLRSFFGSVGIALRKDHLLTEQGFTKLDATINELLTQTDVTVHNALSNNFDTVTALDCIMALAKRTNDYLLVCEQMPQRPSATLLKKVARYATKMLKVFGVIQGNDDLGFTAEGGAAASSGDKTAKVVDALVAFRDDVRTAFRAKSVDSLMGICDKLRDEALPPLGIRLEDKPGNQPTQWKDDDPQVLMRELEEKRRAIAVAQRQKIANVLEKQQRALDKWEPYVLPPNQMFTSRPEYRDRTDVAYDERGIPVKIGETPVDEKAAKKFTQDYNSHKKSHEELQKKGGAELVQGLQKEVAELKAQLVALGDRA